MTRRMIVLLFGVVFITALEAQQVSGHATRKTNTDETRGVTARSLDFLLGRWIWKAPSGPVEFAYDDIWRKGPDIYLCVEVPYRPNICDETNVYVVHSTGNDTLGVGPPGHPEAEGRVHIDSPEQLTFFLGIPIVVKKLKNVSNSEKISDYSAVRIAGDWRFSSLMPSGLSKDSIYRVVAQGDQVTFCIIELFGRGCDPRLIYKGKFDEKGIAYLTSTSKPGDRPAVVMQSADVLYFFHEGFTAVRVNRAPDDVPCDDKNSYGVSGPSALRRANVAFDSKNYKLARCWVTIDAKAGNSYAEAALANLLYQDDYGIKDYKEAFYWATMGSIDHEFNAELILSRMYKYGQGTQKDQEKSDYWLKQGTEHQQQFEAYIQAQKVQRAIDSAHRIVNGLNSEFEKGNCEEAAEYAHKTPEAYGCR